VPLLAVVLAVGAGIILHDRAASRYDASAKVLLGQGDDVRAVLATAAPGTVDLQREANTNLALIRLQSTAVRVRDRLGLRMSPRALLDEVSSGVDNGSNLISITASDRDPARAAAIANAFAGEYQAFRRRVARANVEAALASARARYRALGPAGRASPLGRELAASIPRLEVAAAVQTGDVEVVQRATPPSAPTGWSRGVVAGVAALLGLFVAGVALAVMERLDDRVRDAAHAEMLLGAPVLAELSASRRDSRADGSDALREGSARAAARLRSLLRERGEPTALMITTPAAQNVVSKVTAHLAAALAALGARVTALDASSGHSRSREHEPSVSALRSSEWEAAGDRASATALLAAPRAAGDRTLLDEALMDALIREAKGEADVVLLDAPPLLRGADSLTLAGLADGALLVIEKGRTSAGDARKALGLMHEIGLPLVGLLVVG
jgi:Mrp family chromosome partitioning ATPase